MEELKSLLESVNAMNIPDKPDQMLEESNELIERIVTLASCALIDDNGRNIWENHKILEESGFSIFPGERDRFGWLSGCIQTKKGFIVYG